MFDELLDRTRPLIVQQATTYRDALEPGLKLAVTLRYLAAGNSYVDLAYNFRVANNSISIFIPEMCQAILDGFVDELIPSPNTKERWQLISDEFKNRWNVPNACGALDGKHVAIKKTAKSGSQYYNYNCFFSTVIMALVDANYQFLWADVGGVGSQSYGQIYNASALAEVLRSGEINLLDDASLPNNDRPRPFFFLADDDFALKSNMMKPYSRRNLSLEEKIANYRISRGRRVVENAFGILALRWQCLLSTMQQKPSVVQVIVKTTMVLHNLMDREDDNGESTPGAWRQNANIA